MFFIFLFSFLDLMFIANSSIAERNAIMLSKKQVIAIPNIRYSIGKQNNKIPVNLFAYICKKARVLYLINPTNNELNLIIDITAIHTRLHIGIFKIGKYIKSTIQIKIKSARLSMVAPKFVAIFLLLAI